MCDLVVGTLAPMYILFEQLDFLHGHLDGSSALIIPKPQPVNQNIHAIFKPFQTWVFQYFYQFIFLNTILKFVFIGLGLVVSWNSNNLRCSLFDQSIMLEE